MLFPEGNGGGVVGCRFKRYLLNATRGERSLRFPQHDGTDTVAPVCFEDVDGDDVAPMAVVGGKDESRDLAIVLGHQAVGAWKAKVVAEFAARICDSRLIACLVDCIERFKILGLIFSKGKSQRHKEFVPQKNARRKTKMAELTILKERGANLLLLWRRGLLLLLFRHVRFALVGRSAGAWFFIARKERLEGRNLKRHLLAGGK